MTKSLLVSCGSRTSRLKHLNVYGNGRKDAFRFQRDHGLDLVHRLRRNDTLESLLFLPWIDTVTAKGMVEHVVRENTTLQSLQFSLYHERTQHHQQPRNRTVSNEITADAFCLSTANALLANTTLRTFVVHDMGRKLSAEVSPAGKEALLTMLAYNLTLRQFLLYDATTYFADNVNENVVEDAFRDHQEFFLRLNGLSRGGDNIQREDWIDMFVEQNENLDYLFYFLRSCPTLCDV